MTAGADLYRRLRSAVALVAALLASSTSARAQVPFETLHTFDGRADLGTTSNSIMQARDGDFYLTSARGGAYLQGAIFRMTAAGVVTPLHSFAGGADGVTPFGPLVEATDGNFYGTTERGGAADRGTVFRMAPDGTMTVIHSFTGGATDGANPRAGLIQATDGNLYGTTYYGGTATRPFYGEEPLEWGTIFGMSVTGSITLFRPVAISGLAHPKNRLLQGADGNFYGTEQYDGFMMSASGVVTKLLWLATGAILQDVPMIQAVDGSFYLGCGIIFNEYPLPFTLRGCALKRGLGTDINGAPAFQTTFNTLGSAYHGTVTALIQGADRKFYGATNAGGAFGHGSLFRFDDVVPPSIDGPFFAPAPLYSFNSGTPDALIQAADGNFYGTTSGDDPSDLATVFRMTAAGTVDVLYTFSAPVQGATPTALIQARDGNFYGTNASGGHSGRGTVLNPSGRGTVFKMTPTGTTTDLHVFSGGTTDGDSPNLLVQAADGDFVGTTLYGGAYDKWTIFRMDGAGAVTLLHSFADGLSTGPQPSSLIQGADGNFYGTTTYGSAGAGTAFRMTSGGAVTVLHAFLRDTEGGEPSSLIQGIDGNLYGTTVLNCDVKIFKMTPAGAVTILYTERSAQRFYYDGCQGLVPIVIQANDGYLYGTAPNGTRLYRVSPDGQAAVVRDFSTSEGPLALLAKATDGSLYGVIRSTTSSIRSNTTEVVARISTTGTVAPLSDVYAPGFYSVTVQLLEATDGGLYGIRYADLAIPTQSGSAFRLPLRPPPIGVTVRSAASGWAHLAWRPVSHATSYRIWRRSSSGDQTVIATDVTTTTFVDSTVIDGQRYYYVVTAMTPFGESVASYEVSVTPGMAAAGDFDGDGTADVGVYRPSNGTWFTLNSSTNDTTSNSYQWGVSTDVPVPGDYDGDRKADVAVYRPSTGEWFIHRSSDGGLTYANWGARASAGLADIPVPGDYDGDGKADFAIYRASTAEWFIHRSSDGGLTYGTWGARSSAGLGDIPVPGDYDGDGRTDLAIYRRSTGEWFIVRSSEGGVTYGSWGARSSAGLGDTPVPGDYDGDGRTDFAIYRESSGEWFVHRSSDGEPIRASWGAAASSGLGDIAVPGDYDGDGMTDLAVYRPFTGQWFILESSANSTTSFVIAWGSHTDAPMNKRLY